MNKTVKKLLSFIGLFILLTNPNLSFAQTKEIEIYNEWFCADSKLNAERPCFLIRDQITLIDFWKKTGFGGAAPHIDFERFMFFIMAPGPTKLDYHDVYIEKLLYKEGCLQVLVDFGKRKFNSSYLRPIKAAIFPAMKSGDIFVFKKQIKGWQNVEWKPFFAIWDMNNVRKRPFEYVMVDKEEGPVIVLATAPEEISQPIMEETQEEVANLPAKEVRPVSVVKPVSVTAPSSAVSYSKPAQQAVVQQPVTTRPIVTEKPVTSTAPISAKVEPEKPQTLPTHEETTKPIATGMDEDPLFGSEFDIVF